MNFEPLIPYIQYIVYLAVGLLLLYVKTIITERVKVRTLRKKNKELVEQTEIIKKEHHLEIERRKYQYESKQEQYLKFYKMLDGFTADNIMKLQERMIPIYAEFEKNFLNASNRNDKKGQTNATTVMSKKIQRITNDAYSELTKIKQETNTIRLVASETLLGTLDLLEYAYEETMDYSSKALKKLPALITLNKQDLLQQLQNEIELKGKVINRINKNLITQMRNELNEI